MSYYWWRVALSKVGLCQWIEGHGKTAGEKGFLCTSLGTGILPLCKFDERSWQWNIPVTVCDHKCYEWFSHHWFGEGGKHVVAMIWKGVTGRWWLCCRQPLCDPGLCVCAGFPDLRRKPATSYGTGVRFTALVKSSWNQVDQTRSTKCTKCIISHECPERGEISVLGPVTGRT